jgi:hypothetical protein
MSRYERRVWDEFQEEVKEFNCEISIGRRNRFIALIASFPGGEESWIALNQKAKNLFGPRNTKKKKK